MPESEQRICIGAVAGAHGIKGVVRIRTFTDQPEAIGDYGPVTDESGMRDFGVQLVGSWKSGVLAKLEGVATREAAEALKGVRLYVGRNQLPDADADEFYHADLIGLQAVGPDGAKLGTVRAIYDFGAGDVVEVAPETGQPILLPFTEEVVPLVDLKNGKIVVHPLPGLIDDM